MSLFDCSKDSKDSKNILPQANIPVKNFNYIIYLTNDLKILKLEYFISDTLNYRKLYEYDSGLVAINITDINDKYLSKSKFYLNNVGIADSSIDSVFDNSRLINIDINRYTYDNNGYKTATEIISKNIANDTITSKSTIELYYEIVDGNVKSMYVNGYNSDYYEYNDIDNKFDIISFYSDFAGKKNVKLMKNWFSEIHGAPSTTPPSSEYSYTLNFKGLVEESVEIYSSSFHTGYKPSKEERITKYEYIFQ